MDPIYEIIMVENPDKELLNCNGLKTGFPEHSASTMGFFYKKEEAIKAMHENACDIRECVYDGGFVVKKYPGLYESAGAEDRIFFRWNEEKKGFYEDEEPPLYKSMEL